MYLGATAGTLYQPDIERTDLLVNIAQGFASSAMPPDRADIERQLGLDQPLYLQYVKWIGNIVLHGDFGNSLWKDYPVTNDILIRIPVTFELAFLAMLVALIIALRIGIFSAIR